ncbi:MAG TPA: transcription antitermination factor NusB [Candidatus Caenarcaniphilales bacterium]|nr:transcription antitermination factor NusB [Candidatus Caenarcaniphilales bacterium]
MSQADGARSDDRHAEERAGRNVALGALFEADFGQRTAVRVLDRRLAEEGLPASAAALARQIVESVVRHRDAIDAQIELAAPQYPVVQLARIDRALLRSAMGELLHCPTTPTRVAIAEWVELARTYSGEPARRLLNGVLGRVAREAADRGREMPASGNGSEGG